MNQNLLDINKTKYRYLMDNIDLKGTAITYTIPVDKEPKEINGELNRKYPYVKISYKKLVEMIDKTAKALVALGVKKGDIVIICSSNTPETIYMDYALNKIGAVPSYIYPNVTSDEMLFYFNEVNAKYVYMLDIPEIRKNILKILDKSNVEKIITSSVIESFSIIFKSIVNKRNDHKLCDKEVKWSDFIKKGKVVDFTKENINMPNEICSLIHTSGTSSLPKAVMDTNENINAVIKNHIMEKSYVDYKKGALTTIPFFVEFGKLIVHMILSLNGNLIMAPEYNPKNLKGLIEKFKPITFESTPSHARELLKSNIMDLSYVKMACFGGDGFDLLENDIIDYFKKCDSNAVVINGYGSTEVCSAAISNTILKHKKGSIGIPLGNTKVALFEPKTFNTINTPNIVGEIAISGDTVTLGYYNDKEETNRIFVKHPDGTIWVHMGDYAYFDEEGFYFYQGRIKNIIVRNTLKFSPKEIENTILLCKNVRDCVVVGKYDAEEGQVPSAHIVLKDNSNVQASVNEIVESVNANVQEFHRPVVYKIKDSIVTTRNNKININALKIEDIATIIDGVNDAEISLSADNDYDYDLKIYTDFAVDEQKAIDFIEQTSKNEKVLNGKIKYIFIQKKGKSYYRYEK